MFSMIEIRLNMDASILASRGDNVTASDAFLLPRNGLHDLGMKVEFPQFLQSNWEVAFRFFVFLLIGKNTVGNGLKSGYADALVFGAR